MPQRYANAKVGAANTMGEVALTRDPYGLRPGEEDWRKEPPPPIATPEEVQILRQAIDASEDTARDKELAHKWANAMRVGPDGENECGPLTLPEVEASLTVYFSQSVPV